MNNVNIRNFNLSLSGKYLLFSLSNISFNKTLGNNCIGYLYHMDEENSNVHKTTAKNISDGLSFFGIRCLNIFFITENENILKEFEAKYYYISDKGEEVTLTVFSLTEYREYLESSNFNDINTSSLYVTDNIPWYRIVYIAKDSKIALSISGGSSNKRHLVSKLHIRLICYLFIIFDGSYSSCTKFNNFDNMKKSSVLPYADYSNHKDVRITNSEGKTSVFDKSNFLSTGIVKRSFHSYRNLKDISNEVQNNVNIFSYLHDIDNMISNCKNDKDLVNVQKDIENSWLNIMKKKLENPNNYAWGSIGTIIKKGVNTLEKYSLKGNIKKRSFKLIEKELLEFKIEIILLTFSFIVSSYTKLNYTNLCIQLAERVIYLLFKSSLNKTFVLNPKEEFDKWKINNKVSSRSDLVKLGAYLIAIFTNEPLAIFEEDYLEDDDDKKILKVSKEYTDLIKNNLIVHPNTLPMICEPLEWGDNKYGGFIGNSFDNEDLVVGSKSHAHKLDYMNNLYKTVNAINKTRFSINTDLLKYITTEYNTLFNDENESNDEVLKRKITLEISKIYSSHTFYLNVNCDWRGRIYTNSFFLSYQGNDLSRSLIQFSEGYKLDSTGLKYLYICGANYYGNGLDKKSFNSRFNWVNRNKDKIINLDKKLIELSVDKLQFISFCIVMQKLNINKDYPVKLPIFLDATCSGLQHLAAILKDSQIGALVNLVEKNDNDDVSDIYNELVNPINEAINNYGKDKNNNHPNLSTVKLDRKILKPSIMTQVYNVTVDGIYRQLISKFKKVVIKDKNNPENKGITKYEVPTKRGVKVLEYLDIYKMAELIKNIALDRYPSLREIYNYFINITKLMVKLNIPVIWFTPSGLQITQAYLKSKTEKVSLSYFGKTRTTIIKEWTGFINKNKQSQAIIPNIIHSLDASHLTQVINKAYDLNISPVITIHDCFGTHPNKMLLLTEIVRNEFVFLYTQSNFIEKYHKRIIDSIIDNNFIIESKNDEQYVLKGNKKLLIPKIPNQGNLNLNDINNAKLMIS